MSRKNLIRLEPVPGISNMLRIVPAGRRRSTKSLILPGKLSAAIQRKANAKHGGDFDRAVLSALANDYKEAAELLASRKGAA